MKSMSIVTLAVLALLFLSCNNRETNPTSSAPGTGSFTKRAADPHGLITTQVLMRVGTTDNIISDATVQLLKKNGKTLIGDFQFQPPGDPYPGYWRYFDVDTTETYVLKCVVPPEYSGRAVFSCLTAQYGVGTIYDSVFTLKPSDWFWSPAWGQAEVYPRQFYISNQ